MAGFMDKDTNGDGIVGVSELFNTKPKKPKGPLTIPMIGAPNPNKVGADGLTDAERNDAIQSGYNNQASKKKTGSGGNPYKNMLSTLQKLANYSAGNINSSMDNLSGMLQKQTNPYEGFQAQNTQTTPDFAQLLQSQGVSQDPLQQFASAINTQNRGQADAFQNQANTMRDIYGANQAGTVGDIEAQRAQLMNSLQANTFGTGAALMGKKAPDRNAILQMMLALMGKGGMK